MTTTFCDDTSLNILGYIWIGFLEEMVHQTCSSGHDAQVSTMLCLLCSYIASPCALITILAAVTGKT